MAQNLGETDDILKDLGLNVETMFDKLSVIFEVDFADTSFLDFDFGANLRLADVETQPDVKIPNIKDAPFVTMVMLDPDAPSRENPVAKVITELLWLNYHSLFQNLNY